MKIFTKKELEILIISSSLHHSFIYIKLLAGIEPATSTLPR